MIIGVDADGVLTDMSAFNYEYGERFFKRKPTNLAGYSAMDIFNVSSKEEFKFGLKYFFTYCKKWPPREQAVSVNHKLNADGHKLYEITARKFVTMNNPLGWYTKYLFKKWIRKYQFRFENIIFCSESNTPAEKLNGCKQISAEIMIDDKPDVALHLAENGIKVLLFDAPYNQGVEHDNIIRVYSWDDIYNLIKSIGNR